MNIERGQTNITNPVRGITPINFVRRGEILVWQRLQPVNITIDNFETIISVGLLETGRKYSSIIKISL
jgi:hypothetical protein